MEYDGDSHGAGGVSNCYVFKSRLQEYAQKVGLPTPVYDTVKEGPSHEPIFKSSVVVNNVKYESLQGFYNRKAAEQSAAEIALMEILKAGEKKECIPTLHETGLCKNMLQEYAQKMNYAIPSYTCSKVQSSSNLFICTVEIGGIQYIGAAAKTKKEAEIKAARTALLAIQSSEANNNRFSEYTVLPGKRKRREPDVQFEAVKHIKPKKASKKKYSKRKFFKRKNIKPNQEKPTVKEEHTCNGIFKDTNLMKDPSLSDGNQYSLDNIADNHVLGSCNQHSSDNAVINEALQDGISALSADNLHDICQTAWVCESKCNGNNQNDPESISESFQG